MGTDRVIAIIPRTWSRSRRLFADVLLAAFHSTHAALQLVSSRWWGSPRSILDGFVA